MSREEDKESTAKQSIAARNAKSLAKAKKSSQFPKLAKPASSTKSKKRGAFDSEMSSKSKKKSKSA